MNAGGVIVDCGVFCGEYYLTISQRMRICIDNLAQVFGSSDGSSRCSGSSSALV